MNKTIFYRKLKAPLVISFTFFILIFSSFAFLSSNDEDYILLNKIIERVKNKNPNKSIILKESNNNEYVISFINQLDSLKAEIGIQNNLKFNSIFNQKEYSYFISQKNNSKWDFDKIFRATNSSNVKSQVSLYVSKPIYTKNSNYALIYTTNEKTSCIVIYEKITKDWIEYKIISPMIINPKVNVKNN
jgi:hypothetical protein